MTKKNENRLINILILMQIMTKNIFPSANHGECLFTPYAGRYVALKKNGCCEEFPGPCRLLSSILVGDKLLNNLKLI